MSQEKDLAQLKKEAAARAKEAALAKMQAKKNGETTNTTPPTPETSKKETPVTNEEDLKRLKREAVEKAKAEAQAKLAAKKEAEAQAPVDETEEEKTKRLKREAVAKAKQEALAKKAATSTEALSEEDKKEQKRLAVEKAKAAAQAKKQTNISTTVAEAQKSKNDPVLEKYVKVIEDHVGKEVIKEAYINFSSKEVPTIIIDSKLYFKVTQFLRYNEQLAFDALVELHATDFESSIELYIYLYSYINKQHLVLKTQLDRNNPEIESITPIWPGANWPECEAYDLLGVNFKGHPYLHRILLGEDWVGHPLRKDYKVYDDVEV